MPATLRRRGRPPGSRHSRDGQWFNAPAARTRLTEIDHELERLRSERALLVQVLGQVTGPSARSSSDRSAGAPARGPLAKSRPSMLDLLARIMTSGPADKGWAVGELRDQLLKTDPVRASAANASALISSALVQALRAKTPRFVGTKGGRGHAREYRLAPGAQ
jgi:hypothetical protein